MSRDLSDLRKSVNDGSTIQSKYDGLWRPAKEEERINQAMRVVMKTPAGADMLDYLRSITTNAVMPEGSSDAALREREGMRRLVANMLGRSQTKPPP